MCILSPQLTSLAVSHSLEMATTIRFGTTTDSCRAAADERANRAEETGKSRDTLPHFHQLKLSHVLVNKNGVECVEVIDTKAYGIF